MAYHCENKGHTQIIEGAFYSRSGLRYGLTFVSKLKKYNPITGICKLETGYGTTFYISADQLSNWHLVSKT